MYTLRIETYARNSGDTIQSEPVACADRNDAITLLAKMVANGKQVVWIEGGDCSGLTVGFYEDRNEED